MMRDIRRAIMKLDVSLYGPRFPSFIRPVLEAMAKKKYPSTGTCPTLPGCMCSRQKKRLVAGCSSQPPSF